MKKQHTQNTGLTLAAHDTVGAESAAFSEKVSPLRTPYHVLGSGEPVVPEWAQHRRVYRAAGRTLYLVETNALDTARHDLNTLSSRGWDVRIDQAEQGSASISLTRTAA